MTRASPSAQGNIRWASKDHRRRSSITRIAGSPATASSGNPALGSRRRYTAAARAERGEHALTVISSASKCFASDVAMEVTIDAVQLFGGAGYTTDYRVERMMRDAKVTQIYEGTNQIERVVMSRALLA
jgi:alkylation response protein AidB-like acyl-CoA dehydrogenase